MNSRPERKTENLRIGRLSKPFARYFITLCTESRKTDLCAHSIQQAIINTWRQQHADRDYNLHCATIMPNHIHFLCTLGERITLAQIISKFKFLTKVILSQNHLSWQRNYYDHRLRTDASLESFTKYVFLNPYRKHLIRLDETWPSWILNKEYKPVFVSALKDEKYPQAQWLFDSENLSELIESDTTDS